MSDIESVNRYAVYSGGEKLDHSLECTVRALPEAMFALTQHYGGGTYVAVEIPAGQQAPVSIAHTQPECRAFKMTTEWLEEEG